MPANETDREVRIAGRHFMARPSTSNGWIWDQAETGDWEFDTFTAISQFLPEGALYVDIGGWIGAMTLYAGQTAGRVVVAEPDPIALTELLGNLSLNASVLEKTEVWSVPISADGGPMPMYSAQLGNSMTSLLDQRGRQAMWTSSVSVEDFLERVLIDSSPVFFKVDIEGGEFEVIPRLVGELRNRSTEAVIHLSFHSHFFCETNVNPHEWIANIARTSKVLTSLADLGKFMTWNGSEWLSPSHWGANPLAVPQIIEFGGLATTVLVKT